MKVAYIDYNALNTLALMPPQSDERFKDWQALRNVWKEFRNEKIKLVTSKEDMEMDIILWFNRQGCCITDTLRAKEAIEEFEKWKMADKNHIKHLKRILLFYEQVEILPQVFDRSSDSQGIDKDSLFAFLRDEVLSCGGKKRLLNDDIERTYSILQACSREFHLWYTGTEWSDMKHTDYQLNWDMLASILTRYNMETLFEGYRGERNRSLFGLLNRVVGLCKKSYGKLPIDNNHADFIIKTVLQKYNYSQEERNALHVFRCTKYGASLFVTTDYRLIGQFDDKKHVLSGHPEFSTIRLYVISPSEMELQIRS